MIDDFASSLRADASWPTHPLEARRRHPRWCQYDGAAGAVSALRILRDAGYAAPDLTPRLLEIHARYLERPDEGYEAGLQLGEIGILAPAVAAGVAGADAVERLSTCMRRSTDSRIEIPLTRST